MTEQFDIAQSVLTAWEKFIEAEERGTPSNRNNCYASGYEPCTRKLVLQMTHGDKVQPFPAEVKAKFRRGKDRERNIISDISMVGRYSIPPFEVIGQQERFELRDHKGRVAISGMVDLTLDYGRGNRKVKVEIKDFSYMLTDRILTFDDLLMNTWTRKAARQILCYQYASGEPLGMILLTRPGLPRLIPVQLEDHLDLVEDFLSKAETALDHKAAGTLPGYIDDMAECKRCQFYGIACDPPINSGEGTKVFTDPEVEQKLLRYIELEPMADEYDSIDKWAKASLRGTEHGIAGSVFIQGKWQRDTKYPLSPEAKAEIEKIKAPFKKVEDKGKYFLTVTKV